MIQCLYVHSPYCLHKCGYCDFNSFATDTTSTTFPKESARYVRALLQEAELWKKKLLNLQKEGQLASDWNYVREQTEPSLFFGGGTPSLIPIHQLQEFFREVQELFPKLFVPEAEVTLEANPETVTDEFWGFLLSKTTPINRVSFGVQSFRDPVLRILERQHDVKSSIRLLEKLSQQRELRWSCDFIYGIPGLSLEEWKDDLKRLTSYEPQHVSAYQLTLTQGHPLFGKLPDDEKLREWFDVTRMQLEKAGLHAYETSNFAKGKSHQCRHNKNYWRNQYFIGLGAGASSYVPVAPFGVVAKNVTDPKRYIETIEAGNLAALFEPALDGNAAVKQGLMMGLRMDEGLQWADFRERYGTMAEQDVRRCFEKLVSDGLKAQKNLVWMSSESFGVTPEGAALSDALLSSIFNMLD